MEKGINNNQVFMSLSLFPYFLIPSNNTSLTGIGKKVTHLSESIDPL